MLRILVLLLCSTVACGQGCSDAGLCTIGSMKQGAGADSGIGKHRVALGAANGWGDDGVFVCTPSLQYDFKINSSYSVQARLTGNYAAGNLGSTGGIGDLAIDASRNLVSGLWRWSFVIGLKLPLGGSNAMANGLSLPMQYQNSLGTLDAIAGVSLTVRKWQFGLGCQQPLTGSNSNAFSRSQWKNGIADIYPESNRFHRRGDVLLKAGYSVLAGKHWVINPGSLLVYHLGEDTYTDRAGSGKRELHGSEGATVNLVLRTVYNVQKWSVGLVVGRPAIVRDIRPDGLTRSIVLLPEVSIKF